MAFERAAYPGPFHRVLARISARRHRRLGAIALLMLPVITTQAPAAVLECTYSNAAIAIYKISPTLWQEWDTQAWAWKSKPCKWPATFHHHSEEPAPACKIELKDDQYRWSQNLDVRDGIKKTHYESNLTINRETGALSWDWFDLSTYANGKTFDHNGSSDGTCKAVLDPLLRSKPKKMPKL